MQASPATLPDFIATSAALLCVVADEMWELSMRNRLIKWVMPRSQAEAVVSLRAEMDDYLQRRLRVRGGRTSLHTLLH